MIAVRKLPARYAPIVMPFVLSILMTAVVSVISTFRSLGAHAGVSRDLAGRLGTVMARCLSDAADGAAPGPPDRGQPRRGSLPTGPVAGADGGA
jgi:hypothetical protein